jgi:short-subunit dehydrogenase
LIARDEEALAETVAEVEMLGGKAVALPCDVADPQAVSEAASTFMRHYKGIDIWINNAMVTVFSPVAKIKPDEFKRVMEVNFLGFVHGTQVALEKMEKQGHGKIVLVGSALAYRGIPLQAPYCASKFAIRGFFESLRCELRKAKSPVSLTMVHLPGLNTPQFSHSRLHMDKAPRPVAPVYQPEVASKAIYEAAHSRRREMWVGRSTVMTVLGERLAPGLLERYLAKMAWDGQMTDETVDPTQWPDNLFESAPGDPGAHGKFDYESKSSSLQLLADLHKPLVAASLTAAFTGGVLAARNKLSER